MKSEQIYFYDIDDMPENERARLLMTLIFHLGLKVHRVQYDDGEVVFDISEDKEW